jgi:hypothetical protein
VVEVGGFCGIGEKVVDVLYFSRFYSFILAVSTNP